MRAWFPCVLHLLGWGTIHRRLRSAAETARPGLLCSTVPAATVNSSPRFAPLCSQVASTMRERRALSYAEHACPTRRTVPCSCARRRLARSLIIRSAALLLAVLLSLSLCLPLFLALFPFLSPPRETFLLSPSQKLPRASVLSETSRRAILSRFLANVPSRISAICFLRVACFVSSAPGPN